MKRYSMRSVYNTTACEDQVRAEEDTDGEWVRHEDAEKALEVAEELVASVEWLDDGTDCDREACPWCMADKYDGHDAGCPRQAFLAARAKEKGEVSPAP